jgi:integrase
VARSIRSSTLETRSARLRLPVSKVPIFVKIGPKIGLGYRRNQTAGTWVVRLSDGKGRNTRKAIGTADDYEEADGDKFLDFWEAQECARGLLHSDTSATTALRRTPAAVKQALDRYEADLKTRGRDIQNVSRLRIHVPPALASKSRALLTVDDLREWRDRLRLRPASVNRTCTVLKAALNLAASKDTRLSARAWEVGLATIPDAEEARNVILQDSDVLALIEKARACGKEFGLLVEVAAITGTRVSQISRLEIQDLQLGNAPRLMMPASQKGKGVKKVMRRPVPISAGLAARLAAALEGRAPTAPLLVKPSGEPWKKSDHSRPFARVARSVGLDPKEVTLYALRHSSIVRQLLAGVPIRVVAVNHDTSVVMIERTYSRYIADHADALARAALLDTATIRSGSDQPKRKERTRAATARHH